MEQLKFAEEEKGEGKESASFPPTYSRRLKAIKEMSASAAEKRDSELIPPSQEEATGRKGQLGERVMVNGVASLATLHLFFFFFILDSIYGNKSIIAYQPPTTPMEYFWISNIGLTSIKGVEERCLCIS